MKERNNVVLSRLRSRVAAGIFAVALGGAMNFLASDVRATIIFNDDFSTDTTAGGAITAPTGVNNVTGNSYTKSGSGSSLMTSTGNAGAGNPQPAAQSVNAQSDLALSLASNGGYTKPTTFTVSVDLSPKTLTGTSVGERGVGVGFYSTLAGNQFSNNHYTGFILDGSGNLSLTRDTTTTGFTSPAPFATVAYGGTFSSSNFYTLTFTVNTSSGNLSNVSLSGSTATYDSSFDSTTYFQDPATTYLALYNSGGSGSDVVYIDNVLVQTTPEPATASLLGVGSLALLARRRRNAIRGKLRLT